MKYFAMQFLHACSIVSYVRKMGNDNIEWFYSSDTIVSLNH